MPKITLNDITTGYNLTKVNENFQSIEDALNDQVLYRDNPDDEENTVETDIDMNGFRIINLPEPENDNEPVRKVDLDAVSVDVDDVREELEELVSDAELASMDAEISANEASDSAESAASSLEAAQQLVLDFSVLNNTGDWVTGTNYLPGDLWQDTTDLTWYYVQSTYTSGATEQEDIDAGNAFVYSGIPYTYSYFFVDTVLGDKYEHGVLFNDADTADTALADIYNGTATAAIEIAFDTLNQQLGFKAE